jgi:uncharacterized protein YbbK (DUF523 family)
MADPASPLARARVVLCSGCLLGFLCRYDNADRRSPSVLAALAGKEVVPFCPEIAGGLPAPRPPAELVGGDGEAVLDGQARVVSCEGRDVTSAFRRGAELAIEAARRYCATVAVVREASPSCGAHRVTVDGAGVPGRGVAAAALVRGGLALVSDEELG